MDANALRTKLREIVKAREKIEKRLEEIEERLRKMRRKAWEKYPEASITRTGDKIIGRLRSGVVVLFKNPPPSDTPYVYLVRYQKRPSKKPRRYYIVCYEWVESIDDVPELRSLAREREQLEKRLEGLKVRLYEELGEAEEERELKEREEEISDKILQLLGGLKTMKEEKVYVHAEDGGILEGVRRVGMGESSMGAAVHVIYRCPKCGKDFVIKVYEYEVYDPDKGPKYYVYVDVPEDVKSVPRYTVDEEYRKRVEELERAINELKKRQDELLSRYYELRMKRLEENDRRALSAAEELGIRVLREDESYVYFSDGTVLRKGDITTEAYFCKTSPLFRSIENSEKIWYAIYKRWRQMHG